MRYVRPLTYRSWLSDAQVVQFGHRQMRRYSLCYVCLVDLRPVEEFFFVNRRPELVTFKFRFHTIQVIWSIIWAFCLLSFFVGLIGAGTFKNPLSDTSASSKFEEKGTVYVNFGKWLSLHKLNMKNQGTETKSESTKQCHKPPNLSNGQHAYKICQQLQSKIEW